jgi:outer membrane lipoprotein-sorting protein
MNLRSTKLLLACALLCAAPIASGENAAAASPPSLTAAQIVEQIAQHDRARAGEIKQYKALRHYAVDYSGFSARLAARMDVEATYSAATGKSFRIVSQSGSKLLCEKVLKRAIDSEAEASHDKAATALNEKNYRIQFAGTDTVGGRPAYILAVEPLTDGKFLFRGKVWIDAEDFAIAKMETQPAKNPSFWISHVSIQSTSVKIGSLWLTAHLRSETKVRLGGTAILTIDYGKYTIVPQPASYASATPAAN